MERPAPPSVTRGLAAGLLLLAGCFEEIPENPFDSSNDEGSTGTTTPGTTGTTGSPPDTADDTGTGASTGTAGADETTSTSETGTTEGGESTGPSTHVPCPVAALRADSLPTFVEGSTEGQDDDFGGSCGGGSAPELTYAFTAPRSGSYIFDTGGSAIDTVLYLLDGECEGRELRCNDDGLPGSTASVTSLELDAGQTITVVVDGFGVVGGPVVLSAREGSVDCPVQTFAGPLPQTLVGQNAVANDQFESSCGTMDEPDQAMTFTASQDGIYSLSTEGSGFDTVLFVLDGTCEGRELACNNDAAGSFDGHSALTLPLAAGQTVTAVVEGFFGESGGFQLTADRLPGACPDQDLGMLMPPFMVMGSTTFADEATAGTCGGLGSPDYAYEWTAPFDAVYRFDTEGSGFDTVVYLLDGACEGPELTCNADSGGPLAETAAYLLAGQTVIIVVDGQTDSGPFDLLVEETTDSGDCCVPHVTPGCEAPPIQTCVCTLDVFCCNTEWDGICVDLALASCGAICP